MGPCFKACCFWPFEGACKLRAPVNGDIDVDVEVDVDIDVDIRGVSKSVQVLLNIPEAAMVLTVILLQ